MERASDVQAGAGASALSVKTKFPLGQDGSLEANQDRGMRSATLARLRGFLEGEDDLSAVLGNPMVTTAGLPLLLGVGVDYGVYLVQQGRQLPADTNLLKTGATRAVLFGALVTLANFGDLMLARHPGMVSMGLLLTVGLSMILLCTLVLLPGLIRKFHA